jgi:hypothetical protein
MTLDALAIARRLVAAPWWEWREGMVGTGPDDEGTGWRVLPGMAGPYGLGTQGGYIATWPPPWESVPRLTDDATAGVLLGMLTETLGREWALYRSAAGWRVDWHDGAPWATSGTQPTLGEAVALALLAVRS